MSRTNRIPYRFDLFFPFFNALNIGQIGKRVCHLQSTIAIVHITSQAVSLHTSWYQGGILDIQSTLHLACERRPICQQLSLWKTYVTYYHTLINQQLSHTRKHKLHKQGTAINVFGVQPFRNIVVFGRHKLADKYKCTDIIRTGGDDISAQNRKDRHENQGHRQRQKLTPQSPQMNLLMNLLTFFRVYPFVKYTVNSPLLSNLLYISQFNMLLHQYGTPMLRRRLLVT